jgi:hypothetical protein
MTLKRLTSGPSTFNERHQRSFDNMKNLAFISALILGFSHVASAAANKVCFGIDDAKGSQFKAYITLNEMTISEAQGEATGLEGTHKYLSAISGRDGATYLQFDDASATEGDAAVLVDQDLHNGGTKGLIKSRNRGESFAESKFFCRDAE